MAGLARLDADVILLPEAFNSTMPIDSHTADAVQSLGYDIIDIPYDEGGPARYEPAVSQPVLRLLTRIPITETTVMRLGNLRNAVIVRVIDPMNQRTLRIIGIHLDDRSEVLRLRQLADLIPVINASDESTLMMGDYNAMHGNSRRARCLRSGLVRWSARHVLPSAGLRDFAIRATDMASGTTLSTLLSETDLREADPTHSPTTTPKVRRYNWLPSIRLIDIDHMLVSGGVSVDAHHVDHHDGGSDHRSIHAKIVF